MSDTSPPGTSPSASASTTPSTSLKLGANSSTFVPRGAKNRGSKIVLKYPDGRLADLHAIAKKSRGDGSPGPNLKSATSPAPVSQNGSVAGTPKRKSVRLETEEQRKARLAAEAKEREKKQAEARK